ncbi:MAG: acylase [Flammeovirgaceae bacterium]|nr:acylase [Flammeovirgaceae bacterium]
MSIVRDTYGVPHIYGKTDAGAVFGMLYAQCEDDFARVEMNYINMMGRRAEVDGESFLYHDLRMRLFNDEEKAKKYYADSEPWLKKLCDAYAAGINYYLHTHPEVKPKLITRFEPWMPFFFSEGSIGGDIESISPNGLKDFYSSRSTSATKVNEEGKEDEPRGSNGFAIAPSRTANGSTLLLINPHTTFYFRTETHMISEEGLNAYGAATWGQFFIYQGFNESCGWMHTSSRADVIDEYVETVIEKNGKYFYKFGNEERPFATSTVKLKYKDGSKISEKEFTAYHSHHGPVIRREEDKWVSISLMNRPIDALTQSYMRTKANGFKDFHANMRLRTNSSNNTVYADKQGNIAYYHGNFMPKRSMDFDFSKPVDGSNPATDWGDLHTLNEMIIVQNPHSGWIQNCNSTPFTSSGFSSPKKEDYPEYMARDVENPRGLHAVMVLDGKKGFTLDKLIESAYDSYLPAFEKLAPSLVAAYDQNVLKNDSLVEALKDPIEIIRGWDIRFSESSVATTLSILWAQDLMQKMASRGVRLGQLESMNYMTMEVSGEEKLQVFAQTLKNIQKDFGKWQLPWGEINRFQRLSGEVTPSFDDSKPSYPVAFTSALWGSLASYGSRTYPNTKKMYGNVGNGFVCAVEFGRSVKAKSSVTGGQSSDPKSPHFNDQSEMYSQGIFKDVLYYKEDVEKKVERRYNPGK